MPRTARIKSFTNTYHVMLRGINKQQIFFDDEDSRYFIKLLDRFKRPCGYQLYAYCLMGNHIHLLIRNGEEVSIGEIFRHIGSAFVYWYKLKYERSGHLFQDRYKSEPVNDEAYLLTVLRYILMNPVKAGICHKADGYSYSSAREYLLGKPGITDTAFILRLISKRGLKEYINRQNDDCCLEIDDSLRRGLTDDAAKKIILREFQNPSPSVGSAKDRTALNTSICKLLRAGISIRQLSRLTGISKKIIEKAKE